MNQIDQLHYKEMNESKEETKMANEKSIIDEWEEEIARRYENEAAEIESLNENKIYESRDKRPRYSIHVDPDKNRLKGFFGNPYIKICNKPSWKDATESIRISIKYGYVLPEHSDGKKSIKVTNTFIDDLEDMLSATSTYDKNKNTLDAVYEFLEKSYGNDKHYKEKSGEYPFDKPDFHKTMYMTEKEAKDEYRKRTGKD